MIIINNKSWHYKFNHLFSPMKRIENCKNISAYISHTVSSFVELTFVIWLLNCVMTDTFNINLLGVFIFIKMYLYIMKASFNTVIYPTIKFK